MDTDVIGCSGCGIGVSVSDTGGLCDVCFAGLPDGVWARPVALGKLLADAGENTIVEYAGTRWRFRIEPDDYLSINDFEYYGRVAPVVSRYGEQKERPDGFDGGAEILTVGRGGDRYWWQPYDVTDAEDRRATRRLVCDILEYGFLSLCVERLRDQDDAYGRPVVDAYYAMGAIDPFPSDDVLADLISELVPNIGV
jgi:hypothetical protein